MKRLVVFRGAFFPSIRSFSSSRSRPLKEASEFTAGSSINRYTNSSYFWPFLVTSATAIGLLVYFVDQREKIDKKKMELINASYGSIGQARIGGQPFSLLSHKGTEVDESIFKDKFSILYFGFTHCPDICPDELDKLTAIIDTMDSNPRTKDLINPVFISVDPKRDTPEAIADYLKDFHPKMLGLTGTKEQLLKFAKQYRVYFSINPLTNESKGDYLVDHSVFFYLIGPDGKFVDFFGSDMEVSQIVSKLNGYIVRQQQHR